MKFPQEHNEPHVIDQEPTVSNLQASVNGRATANDIPSS